MRCLFHVRYIGLWPNNRQTSTRRWNIFLVSARVVQVLQKNQLSFPGPPLKLKCGACGQVGHMKTNRECPMFNNPHLTLAEIVAAAPPFSSSATSSSVTASLSGSVISGPSGLTSSVSSSGNLESNRRTPSPSFETSSSSSLSKPSHSIDSAPSEPNPPPSTPTTSGNLLRVEGTKIIVAKPLVEQAEAERRKALLLTIPKDKLKENEPTSGPATPHRGPGRPKKIVAQPPLTPQQPTVSASSSSSSSSTPRKVGSVLHCNYLERRHQKIDRRRIDPGVTMSIVLEEILNEIRDLPDTEQFRHPVDQKLVPDYHR